MPSSPSDGAGSSAISVVEIAAMPLENAATAVQPFSTERSAHWWWLMAAPDVNAVRLLLLVQERADWRDDLPRLVRGALLRARERRHDQQQHEH